MLHQDKVLRTLQLQSHQMVPQKTKQLSAKNSTIVLFCSFRKTKLLLLLLLENTLIRIPVLALDRILI